MKSNSKFRNAFRKDEIKVEKIELIISAENSSTIQLKENFDDLNDAVNEIEKVFDKEAAKPTHKPTLGEIWNIAIR